METLLSIHSSVSIQFETWGLKIHKLGTFYFIQALTPRITVAQHLAEALLQT